MANKETSKNTGIILDTESRKTSIRVLRIGMVVVSLFFVGIIFLPIAWMLLSAFKDTKEFLQIPPTLFPKKIDISKAINIWNRSSLGKSYINSLVISVGKVMVQLLFCGLAGYVLSRLKPKGSSIVQTLVFWSILIPTSMGMVPLYMSLVNMKMLNSYIPFWLMAGANAFTTMLFKSFFDGISKTYMEAARLDGAGELKIFSKIILPLSKPIFMTVSIFCFNESWGDFMWPYLLLSEKNLQPLGVTVYTLKTVLKPDEYLMMLIFVVVPPMIVFIFLQKYIMEGVNVGGIKG